MKLCKMIEINLKYDNMNTNGIINAFICINNHVRFILSISNCYEGTNKVRRDSKGNFSSWNWCGQF